MRRRSIVAALLMCLPLPVVMANTDPTQSGLSAPANNAFTAFSNPAGLTRIRRSEIMGQLVYFYTESTFVTSAESYPGVETVDKSSGHLFIPSVYYARQLSDKLGFGVSLSVPGGIGEDLDDSEPGRYLLDEWTLFYLSLSPALGYGLTDRLSVGGAVNINYVDFKMEAAVFNGPG